MPDDALAPFRNGLFWPDGASALLTKAPGVVSKVLLHVGFTFGLGTVFVLVVVAGRAILKLQGRSRMGVLVSYGLAFALVLGLVVVPERITRVDPDRGVITATRVLPVPPWTTSTEELAVTDVRALGARLGRGGGRGRVRVVRIVALPTKGEELVLGEAECPGADDACLAWADPAVAQLSTWLGWKGKPRVSVDEDGASRLYESAGVPDP